MAPTAAQTRKAVNQAAATITAGKQAKARSDDRAQVFDSIGVIPDWQSSQELQQCSFGAAVANLIELKDRQKEIEKEIKDLQIEIEAALTVAGLQKVKYDGRPVQVVNSRSGSKIVPEKLLMKGVSADVIAECTEPGKEYSYVLIGKPDGK